MCEIGLWESVSLSTVLGDGWHHLCFVSNPLKLFLALGKMDSSFLSYQMLCWNTVKRMAGLRVPSAVLLNQTKAEMWPAMRHLTAEPLATWRIKKNLETLAAFCPIKKQHKGGPKNSLIIFCIFLRSLGAGGMGEGAQRGRENVAFIHETANAWP